MSIKIHFTLLVITVLAIAAISEAQQAKITRIGYLASRSGALGHARREKIQQALMGFGYIEGRNISIEYRSAEGNLDRLAGLAAELVRLKVDVIIVEGGFAVIRAAANATKTIPIVMAGPGLDPVAAGFVKSLAQPGGNITGFTNLGGYLGGKRLEVLKDAIPKLARVAILYQANNTRNMFEFKEVIPTAARDLKLTILRREVRDASDFDRAFAIINKDRPDGIFVLGGPLMNRSLKRTTALAIKHRLASIYDVPEAIDTGGLLYYGADQEEGHQRVAGFVDKIIKGRKPAELPVEQPTRFELVVNLKTAKQIGAIIDPNLLARAQKIIK